MAMSIPEKPDWLELSDREYQVMYLIASGETVRNIADKLDIGIQTVHTYRRRIINKLDIKADGKNSDVMITLKAIEIRL